MKLHLRERWDKLDKVQKTAAATVGALGLGALWWYLGKSEQPEASGHPGTYMRLWNTYYITTSETDFPVDDSSGLYTTAGQLLGRTSHAFAQDLFVEGAGFLKDGRLLNVAGRCGYGDYFTVTPTIHGQQCYHEANKAVTPWGLGNRGRPLVPLRTLATDRHTIPFGSRVYIRQFDGLQIPRVDSANGPIGGFVHDGCFVAEDSGGAIGGNHIDIFAGNKAMMRALERVYPTHSQLDAWIGPNSCGT